MVPDYVFDKTWQEANFVIPDNFDIRSELRDKLNSFGHYGVMHLPENSKAKATLLARVEAIDAYDAKIPKKKEIKREGMESRKERLAVLSAELIESGEVFPFPGINPEAYEKLKADIERDAEKSGYTPAMFDELVERFKTEGMKITSGKYPESGNVFIVPAQSNNIENDNVFPRQLQMNAVTEKLVALALLRRQVTSFAPRD